MLLYFYIFKLGLYCETANYITTFSELIKHGDILCTFGNFPFNVKGLFIKNCQDHLIPTIHVHMQIETLLVPSERAFKVKKLGNYGFR